MARAVRSNNVGLRHLRSAIAAADCGSFRRAAEHLSVQHSVLSRSISQFEYLLGLTIFERSTGGVVPTLAGRRVLQMSRIILEQVDALAMTGRSSWCGEAGHISVGFCSSISSGDLRASLMEFMKQTPQVELSTIERSCGSLIGAILNGSIDVAVLPGAGWPTNQHSLPVWSERILLLLPKDHALAARDIIRWTDLRNQTVLLGQRDSGRDMEGLLASKLIAEGGRPSIVRHDVSPSAITSLISMGLGIGLALESELGTHFASLTHREIQDDTGSSRIGFHAHWRDDNENPALHRFLRLLTERYASPSGRE